MFAVVEFEECGKDYGGLAVIDEGWLTPLKQESFWPPYKDRETFNVALKAHAKVDEITWKLFPIKRIFCETDNYNIAQSKLKKAEITSNLESDEEECRQRIGKRVVKRNSRFSSSSDDEESDNHLPRPPRVKIPKKDSTSVKNSDVCQLESSQTFLEERKGLQKASEKSLVEPSTSQVTFDKKNPSLSFLENDSIGKQILKEILYVKQQNKEILHYLKEKALGISVVKHLPNDFPVELPIRNVEDIATLEKYLNVKENFDQVVTYFSGDSSDSSYITNQILKQLLSDNVASHFSFYGQRSGKRSFSKLKLNKVVVAAVQSKSEANNQKIENYIKVWLKHAPERHKKSLNLSN